MIGAIFFALFIEQLIEVLKGKWKNFWTWVAIVLGIAIATAYNINIFADVPGITFTESTMWFTHVLSGVALAFGTTFLHDLSKDIRK